jgi:hypothetical protein
MKNILFLFYISISAVSYCQVRKMDSLELYNYLNDDELLYDYDYLFIDTSVINNDANRKWDVVFTKSNKKYESKLEAVLMKMDSLSFEFKDGNNLLSVDIDFFRTTNNILYNIDLYFDSNPCIYYSIVYLDDDYMILDEYKKEFLNYYKGTSSFLLKVNN